MEVPVYRSLDEACRSGRLHAAPQSRALAPFVVEPDLPDDAGAMLERNQAGECVFFERESRLCVVHRDLGHEALPATCRHFPRLAVHDRRGTFVSLSHYCPTAAGLLFRDDVSLTIVSAPPAFPPADYEGLSVAADDLPPLLRPGVVMDLDGLRPMGGAHGAPVRRGGDAGIGAGDARARRRPNARLDAGRAGDGRSRRRAAGRLRRGRGAGRACRQAWRITGRRWRPCRTTCGPRRTNRPRGGFGRLIAPAWAAWSTPLRHYLAAKAFASWTAYQGRGLFSIVRGLQVALALVRVEAARACRDADRPLDRELLLDGLPPGRFHLEPPCRRRGPRFGVVQSGGSC